MVGPPRADPGKKQPLPLSLAAVGVCSPPGLYYHRRAGDEGCPEQAKTLARFLFSYFSSFCTSLLRRKYPIFGRGLRTVNFFLPLASCPWLARAATFIEHRRPPHSFCSYLSLDSLSPAPAPRYTRSYVYFVCTARSASSCLLPLAFRPLASPLFSSRLFRSCPPFRVSRSYCLIRHSPMKRRVPCVF